jgi:hypothetical protein
MKKVRFSEEQIVGILRQHEAGRKIAELARVEFPPFCTSWLPYGHIDIYVY